MDYIINIRFYHCCSSTLISFSLLSSHNWLRRALLASWHCSLGSIDDLTVTSDKEEPHFSAALYRRMDGSKHTAAIVVAAPWEGFLSATNSSSGRRTWAIDDWTEMFAETSSDHSGMYAETSSICQTPPPDQLVLWWRGYYILWLGLSISFPPKDHTFYLSWSVNHSTLPSHVQHDKLCMKQQRSIHPWLEWLCFLSSSPEAVWWDRSDTKP